MSPVKFVSVIAQFLMWMGVAENSQLSLIDIIIHQQIKFPTNNVGSIDIMNTNYPIISNMLQPCLLHGNSLATA